MSTKIYNAYKVIGLTPSDLMLKLQKLREVYHDAVQEKLEGYNKEYLAVEYVDSNGLMKALREDAKSGMNTPFNFCASIMVYFHKDEIYIQSFGLDRKVNIEGFFGSHIEDFHYQNQVDEWYEYEGLEGEAYDAAVENWKHRKQIWDEIFENSWSPNKVGMVYELYTPSDYFDTGLRYFQKNSF